MGKIADLYAEINYKFDSVKLREVSKYIGDMNISSIIATTSLIGLGVEMKGLIDQSAALSNNLNILSTTTGVNPQYIQKLEHAAYVLGSSKQAADAWIASLSSLQQKLTVAQGDQRFFTAAQMLGVDPISFQKIIGNTEDLEKAVRKILTRQWAPGDRISQEQFARTKTWLASLINMPTDLLTAIQNPDFQKQFDDFAGLSNAEIKQNIKSTEEWRSLVDKINVEFLHLANSILPQLTKAVDNFVNAGGLKSIADTLKNTADTFYKATLAFEILKNYGKAAALNVGSALSYPLVNAAKFHNELVKDFSTKVDINGKIIPDNERGGKSVSMGPFHITIQADDPHEFTRKFDDSFKRYMDIAARQFTIGAT